MTDKINDTADPVVFVIDDDSAMREAVETLLDSVGVRVRPFDNAQAFLTLDLQDVPTCCS